MGPRNPSRSDKMRSDDKGSRTDPRAKLTGSKSRRKYDGDTKDTAKNQNSHKTTKGSKPSPNVTAKSSKHSQGKSGRINESESEIEVESGSDIDTSTDGNERSRTTPQARTDFSKKVQRNTQYNNSPRNDTRGRRKVTRPDERTTPIRKPPRFMSRADNKHRAKNISDSENESYSINTSASESDGESESASDGESESNSDSNADLIRSDAERRRQRRKPAAVPVSKPRVNELILRARWLQMLRLSPPATMTKVSKMKRPWMKAEFCEFLEGLTESCVFLEDEICPPSEREILGRCPVVRCGRLLRDSQHSGETPHDCRRNEAREIKGEEVQFCTICIQWVGRSQWEGHLQWHLSSCLGQDCGLVRSASTIIRPALCPFCLGNASLSPEERMAEFDRLDLIYDHIQGVHLSVHNHWPLICPHPECSTKCQDIRYLGYHLRVAHGLYLREFTEGVHRKKHRLTPDREVPSKLLRTDNEHETKEIINLASDSDSDSLPDLSKTLARKADAGHKDKKITADPAEASMESQEVMQALWGKRGYPQINWERVPSRVRELKSWLETCLTAQSVPPFRERYVHQLFLPRRGILNDPLLATSYGGYYGPRGENQVIEELIFLLREAMTNAKEEDDIIHRNPVQYYRHVLVPATIHRFIQEDMGQNAEDALTTMEESTDLGHYFNEDCDVLEMPDNASNESASQTATNELLRDTN